MSWEQQRQNFFQVGGTLSANAPSYISRPADDLLLQASQGGELCMVLAPRQTGKSSLMIQAMTRLRNLNIVAGYADFQGLTMGTDPVAWFSDIVRQLCRSLGLSGEAVNWFDNHTELLPGQRFLSFLEDVLLQRFNGPIVLFFDEVDSALALEFSDLFFTTIRSWTTMQAWNPELKRLSMVLLGVASAADFIKDKSRTPFNVGRDIPLTDFEVEQLQPFCDVLGEGCTPVVQRIFYWTSGQPRMVQGLARKMYDLPADQRSPDAVDRAVEVSYFAQPLEKDVHLDSIRNYLLDPGGKTRKVHSVRPLLKLYRRLLQAELRGKQVVYDEQSVLHERLVLSGVATVADGKLISRNRIYARVFDEDWVKVNLPRNIAKTVAWTASAALVGVLGWFLLVQPLFFPNYIKHQRYRYFDEDIFYLDTPLKEGLALSLPAADIRSITVNGQSFPWTRQDGRQQAEKPDLRLSLPCPALKVGPNRFVVRYSSGFWGVKYEQHINMVYYPKSEWQRPAVDMVTVAGDCFQMGCLEGDSSCYEDEIPRHKVCLSGFSIGRFELTQEQWHKVMGYNPSSNQKCGGNCPVENVSWEDAQLFLARLGELSGDDYRLPTEAEWEYAARSGGRDELYAGGDDLERLGWFDKNSGHRLQPVGRLAPNGLGLFDMSGNVDEWTEDWYGPDYYSKSPMQNPAGPVTGAGRVFRGGSWILSSRFCRASYRFGFGPGVRVEVLGFRLVLPGQQVSGVETEGGTGARRGGGPEPPIRLRRHSNGSIH